MDGGRSSAKTFRETPLVEGGVVLRSAESVEIPLTFPSLHGGQCSELSCGRLGWEMNKNEMKKKERRRKTLSC